MMMTMMMMMTMTMTMTMTMMMMIRKAVDGERSSRMSKFSSLTLFVVAATFITLESTAALFDHQGIQLMFIFNQLWEKKLSILGRKHQSLNCFIIFNSSLPEANLANKNFKDFCLIIKSWQPSFLIDKKKLCQPPSS